METDKEEFLKEFGSDYGYPDGPKSIEDLRASEFKRLEGLVYLDHAGATLYSELQMEAVFKDLSTSVYGNPHSQSNTSAATGDIVKETRIKILDYCNASPGDYKCIFTSGATGALKLVGEAFPWSNHSCFMYTMENHNSVIGIREYAFRQGAVALAVDIEETEGHPALLDNDMPRFKLSPHSIQRREKVSNLEEASIGKHYNLFAFPSECNFSGTRFNLDMVKSIKEEPGRIFEESTHNRGCWMVLVDAAKGCSTEPPDLSKHPTDFLVISFYKLFGYPTGLGALIVRNEAAKLLKPTYFSGGTVAASVADIDFVKRREGVEELFEHGTASFLGIASVNHGFKILNFLTKSAISRHIMSLTTYVRRSLSSLRHGNGAEVCTLYGRCNQEVFPHEVGSIATFNLKRPDGSWFGYREVEKLAALSGIQLRTGCFCNPGACAKYLSLSHSDLLANVEAGHVCWDDYDIVQGKPTGAVRVSFGYMSTFEDSKKFIDFVMTYFVSAPNQCAYSPQLRIKSLLISNEGPKRRLSSSRFYLRSITIYPIKSCAGFNVDHWPLSSTGLQYDREWLLKSLAGEVLTQKKVPEMSLIRTSIDLEQGILLAESPRCSRKLQINLKLDFSSTERAEIDMHGQRFEVLGSDIDVNTWFSHAVGRPCKLLRSSAPHYGHSLSKTSKVGSCRNTEMKLNFSNEAQLLLISEESVSDLNRRMKLNDQKDNCGPPKQISSMRFRPNLVVYGGEPYAEDNWRLISIGNNYFMCLGGCNRCQMINLDNTAGQIEKSSEPLATLASYRRTKGKILFGILLGYEGPIEAERSTDSWIQVGQEVKPKCD